ncbi:sporulation protein YpjB [Laceyella putida]|uniref:Sporulation protein YpjB n=1 Tax=Laceyella putida TaxID=110101 RepID=A0ABW2RM87_9BACL
MQLRWMGSVMVVMLLLSFIHPVVQAGEIEREREEWSQMAEKIETEVQQGHLMAAREDLAVLARQFSKADWLSKKLTLEAVHILAEVLMELEWSLNQVRPDPTKLAQATERMRLAFDALSHPNQPLWQRYYEPLKEGVAEVKQAVKRKQDQQTRQAIEELYAKVQLVRPALIVAKSPYAVHKMDSLITFIRKEKQFDRLASAVGQLEQLLYPLFYGSEQDVMATVNSWNEAEVISLTYWLMLLIVAVLAYVAWRKYRGESPPVAT